MIEIPAGKVSDLQDGQRKEISLNNYKVLLSKVHGQLYATSHKCTHYGAPLINGVFSSNGRITCPWHGACFSAITGDIEDSPALDHLRKYKVIIKGEDVFVEADEEDLKAARKITECNIKEPPLFDTDVVIIGGGAAGNAAAEKLREDGFNGQIIVVSRERYLPIDRPKLSKSLGMQLDRIGLRKKEFYDSLFITFKLGTTVIGVNATKKHVTLDNNEILKYSKLIIASGASPRPLPVPGAKLGNIFYLRTFDDYEKIEKAVGKEERKDLVIIGSSFIGLEVAAVCTKKANVSVVGLEKVPFERIFGLKIGTAIQKLHESNGVKFYLQATVKEIQPSETDKTRAGAVVLGDGKKIYADFIVIGAGVKPATEFLKFSPEFKLEEDGSLKVNDQFKVEGHDDVFAIGDIARFPYHVTGETLRIEHWSFAENTGRAVAGTITNTNISPFRKIPYFWSNQLGKGIRYVGYASSFDDVIIQGDLEELKFAAYYARGDKIIAVCTISKDPWASHCSELLRLGKLPSATEIRNGKDPIEVPLTD